MRKTWKTRRLLAGFGTNPTSRRKTSAQPRLEGLERKALMAGLDDSLFIWVGPDNGVWSNPSNWEGDTSGGPGLPSATASAQIPASFTGTVRVSSDAEAQQLDIQGGTVKVDAGQTLSVTTFGIKNAGTLVVDGDVVADSNMTTSGTVQVAGLLNVGNYTQTAGTTKLSGGTLNASTGIDGGGLEGSGVVDGILVVGTNSMATAVVRPGGTDAIGTISSTGALSLGTWSKLFIELNGSSTSQFDRLTTTGVGATAAVAGQLDVKALAGYTPEATTYQFLASTGARTGTFSSVALPAGLVKFATNYQSNGVSIDGAADVTSNVTVSRSGASFIRSTRRFRQTITITNTGVTALTAPISIALDNLTAGVQLFNKSGDTSVFTIGAGASPYINLSGGPLGVGESRSIVLEFKNGALSVINYQTRVLMGPGPR